MKPNNKNLLVHTLCICLFTLFGSGCSSTVKKESAAIFYPALPNPPHLQFLTSLSTARDLTGENSGFADFVLGEDIHKDSLISKPYGLAAYKNKIYAIDIRGPSYAVFDLANNKTYTVFGNGAGRLKKPINMSIDEQGEIFITDTQRNQILQFDQNDRFVRSYGDGESFKPSDVAVSADKLFISDVQHHQIHVLERASGKTLYSFGKGGSKQGEMLYPTNIDLAADGHLYVSDTGNSRIEKFTQDGKFVQQFGQIGSGLGQFARPKGIAVDAQGQLYVVDAAFENVQVFNPNGKLLLFFGGINDAEDRLILPADIEISTQNLEYFQRYARDNFKLQYLLLISNQFGSNKISVYGYGHIEGMNYNKP